MAIHQYSRTACGVLSRAWTNHFKRLFVATWRVIESKFTWNVESHWVESLSQSLPGMLNVGMLFTWNVDSKHIQSMLTWKNMNSKTLVASLSWSETYKLENYLWRCSEPIHTRYSLTFDILKLLVARWRASPSSWSDKSFSKILCSEVASHLV